MAKSVQAHPLGQDDRTHRLRDVLERLAMDRDALLADIRQTATDDKSLLRRLVREIDEVVLPRRIALRSQDGEIATLTASNRRMIELQTQGAAVLPDGDAEPDAVARAYAQVIKTLGEGAGHIALRQTGRSPQSATNSTACSAALLAEAGESLGHENRLQVFLQRIQAQTKGWILYLKGEPDSRRSDDPEVLQQLHALHAITTEHRSRPGPLSRLDRSGPSCSTVALPGSLQAIIVTDGPDRLLAAVSQYDVIAVVNQWQAVYGRSGPTQTL